MGIFEYLSREPNGEPWPESELDEKFVVTSIENFRRALYCLNNRVNDMVEPIRNKHIIEHFVRNTDSNNKINTSSHVCYSNQIGSKRTRLDRNVNVQNSRTSNSKTNTLCNFSHSNQLAKKLYKSSAKNKEMENANADNDRDKVEKDRSGKKKVRISDIRQGGGQDQVKEQVMETIFQRKRLIKQGPGANNDDTDSSDSEIPYVEER